MTDSSAPPSPAAAADTPLTDLSPLRAFVAEATVAVGQGLAESDLLARLRPALAALVARDGWLPPELAAPHPQFYRQYLLHVDPLARFSVVSFVWGPGQRTPVHDHTVWGLIGVLRGEEESQDFAPGAGGRLQPVGTPRRLRAGDVAAVSPTIGDIHRVSNAVDDRVSISIHVYGADIGRVHRWVYAEDGSRKPFVSGYSSTWVPNLWALPPAEAPLPETSPEAVRAALRAGCEIALVDVREEDPFAQAHPLWAVQLAATRLELDAPWRLPRPEVPVVVYDDGEGLAEPAARWLRSQGWGRVSLLTRDACGSGLGAWRDGDGSGGGELFRDVNVPSKAFGELVEHEVHTPSLPAPEVKALIDGGADVVVLDARRFDEYQTMSIPRGTSVPGAELALRVRDLAPDPATTVIVNCAGRTRSIIGTQSLLNAGIPNRVLALRNGTIGWTLAGFALDHGQQRRFGPASPAALAAAQASAQSLADRAGARRLDSAGLAVLAADTTRTLYRWDVRTPEEYAAGHRPGFGSAPGGQLVQETDVFVAVRGARVVLADGGPASDGVRAPMTAHWLAQLGWEVHWLTDAPAEAPVTGAWQAAGTPPPAVSTIDVPTLAAWLADAGMRTTVLDLATSANHVKGHIPGARWVLRSQLAQAVKSLPPSDRLVLTCGSSLLARFAAADLARLADPPWRSDQTVVVLDGGNAAWAAAGQPLDAGEGGLLSPRIDRYRRPYEGTNAPREAMQAYLDWEFGLVEQLGRDGTHGFRVLRPA